MQFQYSIDSSSVLVRPCLRLSIHAHVPFLKISYYTLAIALVSASFSHFTLGVLKREASCAWDPRSL